MAKHILLINGPNLNLLGLREPHIYGTTTLAVLEASLQKHCASLLPPVHLTTYQSNHEGAIIDMIHKCRYPELVSAADGGNGIQEMEDNTAVPPVSHILINPGALTHTSVALRDALAGVALPFLEIHITNVHAREAFRHQSFLSEKAVAVVCGLGVWGYRVAVDYCIGGGELGG